MKKNIVLIYVLAIVVFTGCEKIFFEPEPENNPEALFENLWTTFNTDYATFEERGVVWADQYEIYRPQVSASTTNEELKTIFKSLLATLNDGHVSFITPGENAFYSNSIINNKIDFDLFNLDIIKSSYMKDEYKEDETGVNTYGWIDNIGYWHIGAIGLNMLETNVVLDYFASADGLIVDMRHNKGGNFTYSFSEFGRFTDQERFVFSSKTKNGKGPDDFTDLYEWNITPSDKYFDKPIVLITDRYTVSAGERMVMAFKTLPNVTHIGDTTNGAFSTKIGKELANGWYYTVVTQKIYFNDGVSYEGVGMAPDIYMKNSMSEMENGQDKTLEWAIDKLTK